MAEPEDKPPALEGQEMRDIRAGNDSPNAEDVPHLEAQDHERSPTPVELQNTSARGHQRREYQDDGSEMGSVDTGSVHGLPRRVGSPIDSIMSGPDDTPSIQVRPATAYNNSTH